MEEGNQAEVQVTEKKENKKGNCLIFVIPLLLILVFFVYKKVTGNKISMDNLNTTSLTTSSASGIPASSSSTGVQSVEGLEIEDLKIGDGEEAVSGKKVVVNYLGTLKNGTKFDSSYDRGTPFSFTLGTGEVIEGWEKGILGMRVGGKRKLTISPELGYGPQAVGEIPANSTLIFEVELLQVLP